MRLSALSEAQDEMRLSKFVNLVFLFLVCGAVSSLSISRDLSRGRETGSECKRFHE